MSRREEEEFHASQNDRLFVCDDTFTDCGVSWSSRGDTIAAATSGAMGAIEAQEFGCGEYALEIYSEDRGPKMDREVRAGAQLWQAEGERRGVKMKKPEDIVTTEVLCCATQLIATLASGPSFPLADQARSLFGSGERDDQEILSHWFVSYWLAERLERQGETVDRNFAGLAIWGRKTTGQRIECDDVIRKICEAKL